MKSDDRQLALLCAALVAVGSLAWLFTLREPLQVDGAPLRSFPLQIGDWSGRDLPLEDAVERMLNADFNLQRVYTHPTGDVVWLYVGYYGTRRGGRPEHTPWQCYPSNGWEILRHRAIDLPEPHAHRANEFVVEAAGSRRLVHFWYQSYRRQDMLGGLDQMLDRLLGRLTDGRADGALVRLSTQLPEDGEESLARSRLISLASEIVPLLHSHWPSERSQAPGLSISDPISDPVSEGSARDRLLAPRVSPVALPAQNKV